MFHCRAQDMAPKESINRRFSKTQPDNISFKSKRRRKLKVECNETSSHNLPSVAAEQNNLNEANKTYKSPKHRWKLNTNSGSDEESISDANCMTNTRPDGQCFQERVKLNSLSNQQRTNDEECHQLDERNVEKCREQNGHHSINARSSCSRQQSHIIPDVPTPETKKPQRHDFVNCRKFRDWTTPSNVRKLLPIFVLVNMLPFLYAGESIENSYACRLPVV